MTGPDDDGVAADDEFVEDLRASGRHHDPDAIGLLGGLEEQDGQQ